MNETQGSVQVENERHLLVIQPWFWSIDDFQVECSRRQIAASTFEHPDA